MNSLIEIFRSSQYVNKFRNYKIVINGIEKGTVGDGKAVKINMDPGEYEVYLTIDWCRSNTLKISIKENELVQLRCGSPVKGWKKILVLFYVIFKQDEYLYLERVT